MVDQPSTLVTVPLIVVGFAIVFSLVWVFVIGLISLIGGWQRLAQRYRAGLPPVGQRWSRQYGMVGWASYKGVLTLTASSEGLFMETIWMFGFGHPRLFIPWQDFREAEVQSNFFGRFRGRRLVSAKIGFPSVATVRLPAAVFEESAGRKVLINPT